MILKILLQTMMLITRILISNDQYRSFAPTLILHKGFGIQSADGNGGISAANISVLIPLKRA